jgi:RNA polymerase sigma factor (sigma-70 family)
MSNQDNWIARLRAGDQKALNHFFHMYCITLSLFAGKMLKNEQQSEETVNDVFLKLWHNRNNIKNQEHVRRFLYYSLRNACIDILRQTGRTKAWYDSFAYFSAQHCFQPDLVAKERITSLRRYLEHLPVQGKMVVILSFYEDIPNSEISKILMVSINTVKTHKARAIKVLRRYIR